VHSPSREAFNVLVPPPVQAEIDERAGYGDARRLLGADPCHPVLAAYRLSGPLEPIVCGVRLKRGYRLSFTTQPPLAPSEDGRVVVVVLYVGKREPGHRTDDDVWDILHELFGVPNPPAGHEKPPCCEGTCRKSPTRTSMSSSERFAGFNAAASRSRSYRLGDPAAVTE
jgi:hypothetical protein